MSSENYIRDGITGETMANANCRKKSVLFVCLGKLIFLILSANKG